MEKIPLEEFERDREKLLLFLRAVRDESEEDKHYKIISFSQEISYTDPLSVLDSIYQSDEFQFYMENPTLDEGMFGSEAVLSREFEGKNRFQKAKEFILEVEENCICVGATEQDFSGPHFFTAFTFDEEQHPDNPFAAASLFLPNWQVAYKKGSFTATANLKIDADTNLDQLADRLFSAHEKFEKNEFTPSEIENLAVHKKESHQEELRYKESVKKALDEIQDGNYEKIVLSRTQDYDLPENFQPSKLLFKLRERFPSCYTFLFENSKDHCFIGASPERLIRVDKQQFQTVAIAASRKRGKTVAEDAALARDLMQNNKDQREHQAVIDSINSRLKELGIEAKEADKASIIRLANIQHLHTEFKGQLNGKHILDLASALHPTPAVGGRPRENTLSKIKELEKFNRGLFAGAIGWISCEGDGELIVGLRSALKQGRQMRLFAGAGIVEGSDPSEEEKETRLKLQSLEEALTS